MIIKFDDIRSVLPEELVMITNIFNEIREKQCSGIIGDISFIVSSNTEEDQLNITLKLERNKIFNCFNKQGKKRPASLPRK